MSYETVNPEPEELANTHRYAYNELKRAKRLEEDIHKAGLFKRGASKIKGETSVARRKVEEAQKDFVVSSQIPKEEVDAIQGRVEEIRATRKIYDTERQRIVEEVTSQYKKRVEAMTWPGGTPAEQDYIHDYEELSQVQGVSPDTTAKVLAVRDVFFPKIDNPGYAGMTFMIGEGYDRQELAVHNGDRFPRFEIGSDVLTDAIKAAKANGWQKVVKMSAAVTADQSLESGKEPYVIAEKSVFTAVSNDTAHLLELTTPGMNRSSSLYEAFGRRRGMGTGTASSIEFSTVNVGEVQASTSQAA